MLRAKLQQAGTVLEICLCFLVVCGIIVVAAVSLTSGFSRSANRSEARTTATQIGLGALDIAFSSWREIARRNWNVAPTSDALATVQQPVAADFGSDPKYVLSAVTVTAVTPQLDPLSGSVSPVPSYGPSDKPTSYFYKASVNVTAKSLSGPVTTKVRRVFEKQLLSPWNYAIFYDGDLEIHPGAPQTITGWVHTNGILYTAHDSLTFGSRATSVGGWNIGFMPGDGQHPDETPQSPSYQADIPPARDTNHQPFGIDPWAVFAVRHSEDNSNDGWIELIKRPVPGVADPQPDASPQPSPARYYNQADIHILVDASNNVTMTDITGNEINESSIDDTRPGYNLKDAQLYNAFKNAVTPNINIQDNREGTTVRLASLDVSKITAAVNNGSLTSFKGIVYIADKSAGTSGGFPKRGIKITNAAAIPNGGLSVISENPVYIAGNVNTGLNNPPSNTVPDFTRPLGSGYTSQPTLIAGDAITVLSNAWNDASSTQPLANRKATNTTVNAALLGGIIPSGSVGSNYSGGAENFTRFLEDWSGTNFTYYGSLVCLFNSAQATGVWGKSSVYNPPDRHWYFDDSLKQKPPPGSLVTASYLKDRWWTE